MLSFILTSALTITLTNGAFDEDKTTLVDNGDTYTVRLARSYQELRRSFNIRPPYPVRGFDLTIPKSACNVLDCDTRDEAIPLVETHITSISYNRSAFVRLKLEETDGGGRKVTVRFDEATSDVAPVEVVESYGAEHVAITD